MLYPPGFYYVKKPKRFVILSTDKSSECNLSCFFDIEKPRRIEHLQSEEPFSSDPYFSGMKREQPVNLKCASERTRNFFSVEKVCYSLEKPYCCVVVSRLTQTRAALPNRPSRLP